MRFAYLLLLSKPDPFAIRISVVVNDLLSFYKESIVSTERNNSVYNSAVARGVVIARALDEIAKRAVECIGNVRSVLSSEPKILRYVDSFIRGCVAIHGLPRYKLSECNIPELLQHY
ncbi:predicted protein [Aspergillus terreus NIH2624]|uniref:Uncharacterized protein n=1 Tax=Aspergillus terreus (strain NIH 2624 / FGSC A1156) TaxID=341663 RepID=Q0CBN0_ASPTN|nr:uncharacterized protein ATEG_08904 [Aspergillus terreus NIH2624]EAU31036.1 predicted protein [Aspergillus terreus NIH2624]